MRVYRSKSPLLSYFPGSDFWPKWLRAGLRTLFRALLPKGAIGPRMFDNPPDHAPNLQEED